MTGPGKRPQGRAGLDAGSAALEWGGGGGRGAYHPFEVAGMTRPEKAGSDL